MQLSQENWIRVANEFNYKWQLPNCLGAFDGKHIPIMKPKNSGSDYFNFKRYHSIILMAVADANYKFLSIDVGGKGSEGDAHIFSRIKLGQMINEDNPDLNLPPDAPVGDTYLPYFFLGDDAFPLMKRLMKPYSPKRREQLSNEEEICNYRISRARRCVENAFGILTVKWGCIGLPFRCKPDKTKRIVAACCLLHNFLLNRNPDSYIPNEFKDLTDEQGTYVHGIWRRNSTTTNPIHFQYSGRSSQDAKTIRNKLKDFVNSPAGSVPFQRRGARIDL